MRTMPHQRLVTGADLRLRLADHWVGEPRQIRGWTPNGYRTFTVRDCNCNGWRSHPDEEQIEDEALYEWRSTGTLPAWVMVWPINTTQRGEF